MRGGCGIGKSSEDFRKIWLRTFTFSTIANFLGELAISSLHHSIRLEILHRHRPSQLSRWSKPFVGYQKSRAIPYDTIPEDSLLRGCSGRRGVGGWGGVSEMKWNKRQNRWFIWNKTNLEQKPEAIPEQENQVSGRGFERFQRWNKTANTIFFWAAFGGYFQYSQPLFRIRLSSKISS